MTDLNYALTESLVELRKLIQMMDEDAPNLSMSQAISDYIAPILDSMISEIEVNRQYAVQTNDRVSLALMMSEKTFLGDILTNIAEHFATVVEEVPSDTDPESKLGVALGEIQDLLATWMSFDLSEDEDEDEDGGDDGDEEDDGADADEGDGDSGADADETAEGVDVVIEVVEVEDGES